jgi:hypothetical protein
MRTVNKPIRMIAHFLPDGSIKPLRFQLETDEGELQAINIDGSRVMRKDKTYIEYECAITLNETKRRCNIRYLYQDLKWVLYGIN